MSGAESPNQELGTNRFRSDGVLQKRETLSSSIVGRQQTGQSHQPLQARAIPGKQNHPGQLLILDPDDPHSSSWYDGSQDERFALGGMGDVNQEEHAKRREVSGIHGTLKHAQNVEVIDVTPRDLTVFSPVPLPAGKQYDFKLTASDRSMNVKGTVVWCAYEDTVIRGQQVIPRHRVRMALEHETPQSMDAFQDFLAETLMITLKRRIIGSFGFKDEVSKVYAAAMDSTYIFHLEKLSGHGMKVVTSLKPATGSVMDMEFELNGDVVTCRARVVHCIGSAGRHELKLDFVSMSDRSRTALTRYLRFLDQGRLSRNL